jgi:hypothetical protein
MKYGLLWYDNDPRRPLEDKIGRAARRYHDKYGSWPNTCFVHPEAVAGLEEQELKVRSPARKQDTIQVVSASNVLLHHFWLGENQYPIHRKGAKAAN